MSQLAHIGVRVLAIALFLGALGLLYKQIHAQPEIVGTGIRIQQLHQEIDAAEREIRTLQELLAYRQSEGYVLEVAKRDLSLVEPGEQQLQLIGLAAPTTAPALATVPVPSASAAPAGGGASPVHNLAAWWNVLNGR